VFPAGSVNALGGNESGELLCEGSDDGGVGYVLVGMLRGKDFIAS
jgi:hypothetical protein